MYFYVERIRDFLGGYALYKFTFYLLTYLLILAYSTCLLDSAIMRFTRVY